MDKRSAISKRNIRIYYFTSFLDALVFFIPIIIVFLNGIITPVEVSFIFGWRYFVQFITELPTGAIADIFGKRISVILSFLCFAICYVLLPFSKNFMDIFLIYTFSGLGNSLSSGATEALVYDSLVQDGKAAEFSSVQTNQNLYYQMGLILSTFLGGYLYTFNHLAPFFAYALSSVIAFLLSFFYTEPLIDTVKFTVKNYLMQIQLGVKELFKNAHITKVSLFYIIVGGITWTCALYFNSYMLVDLGFGDSMRGILEASLRLINLVLLTRLLKNEKFFNRKKSYLFFPVAMIAGLLPGVLLSGYFGLPFVALSMMSASARWVILGKYTNDEFSSKYRATAISALSMGVGILYVIITVLSGPVIANWGGVRTVFTLLGALSVLLVLPLSFSIVKDLLRKKEPDSAAQISA